MPQTTRVMQLWVLSAGQLAVLTGLLAACPHGYHLVSARWQ